MIIVLFYILDFVRISTGLIKAWFAQDELRFALIYIRTTGLILGHHNLAFSHNNTKQYTDNFYL